MAPNMMRQIYSDYSELSCTQQLTVAACDTDSPSNKQLPSAMNDRSLYRTADIVSGHDLDVQGKSSC